MAESVGIDFLLKSSSNTIGGREGATLNLERDSAELAPTQTTGTTFARSLTGLKDFSIDFDALWIANGNALNGFSPEVVVDPSTTDPPALEFISEVSLTIERELIEFNNSSNAEYLSRGPSTLRMSAEITADVDASTFYSSGNASRLLLDAWDSTAGEEDVEIRLPNNDTSFSGSWTVPSISLDAPTDDAVEATFSLESDGQITETLNSNLGSGLNDLITNIFQADPSSLTAIMTTETSGAVEFEGPVFASSIDITIPVEGSEDGVNTSGTLSAAGPLTIQETT